MPDVGGYQNNKQQQQIFFKPFFIFAVYYPPNLALKRSCFVDIIKETILRTFPYSEESKGVAFIILAAFVISSTGRGPLKETKQGLSSNLQFSKVVQFN
jgi:hypothetical protein